MFGEVGNQREYLGFDRTELAVIAQLDFGQVELD